MSKPFAKLFHFDDIGQVLVMLDQTEDMDKSGSEIRVHFTAPGFGVCANKFLYEDSDDGHDKAEKAFEEFSSEQAYGMASAAIEQTVKMFGVKDETVS